MARFVGFSVVAALLNGARASSCPAGGAGACSSAADLDVEVMVGSAMLAHKSVEAISEEKSGCLPWCNDLLPEVQQQMFQAECGTCADAASGAADAGAADAGAAAGAPTPVHQNPAGGCPAWCSAATCGVLECGTCSVCVTTKTTTTTTTTPAAAQGCAGWCGTMPPGPRCTNFQCKGCSSCGGAMLEVEKMNAHEKFAALAAERAQAEGSESTGCLWFCSLYTQSHRCHGMSATCGNCASCSSGAGAVQTTSQTTTRAAATASCPPWCSAAMCGVPACGACSACAPTAADSTTTTTTTTAAAVQLTCEPWCGRLPHPVKCGQDGCKGCGGC